MSAWLKGAMNRATTANDDRVIQLHSEDDPPPALHTTWRSIMSRQRRIEDLTRQREQAQQNVARLNREIASEEGKKLEDQGRWVIMTKALGIDIQDEPEGVE